jgi:hypothetical protein
LRPASFNGSKNPAVLGVGALPERLLYVGIRLHYREKLLGSCSRRTDKGRGVASIKDFCYSRKVIIMSMGSDHEIDFACQVNANSVQVRENWNMPGPAFAARIDDHPSAVTQVNSERFTLPWAENRNFYFVERGLTIQ